MLPIYTRNKAIIDAGFYFLLFLLIWVSIPVFAQGNNLPPAPAAAATAPVTVSVPTAQGMLANIGAAIPNLMRLVTALAYVMGFVMIISGIMKLKHVGEMRTQMSHEHNLAGPVAMIFIGSLLIYLPSSVQVGMSTFWTNPNPYGYVEQQDQWAQAINICYLVVQFVGTIAFIRGLILLSHIGSGHGGQQGALSRAMTHIIGGLFCINIYQFIQVIFATLGISVG